MKLGLQMPNVLREIVCPGLGATFRRLSRIGLVFGAAAGMLPGCGYVPVYGQAEGSFRVESGRVATASFEAAQSVLDGVRSELGLAHALGQGPPLVTVEILRVDERSIGVLAAPGSSPLARGAEITVVGRASVRDTPEAPTRLDTGDMSRSAQYSAGGTAAADAAARQRAVREAARNLGKALGRVVLGLPEPAEG